MKKTLFLLFMLGACLSTKAQTKVHLTTSIVQPTKDNGPQPRTPKAPPQVSIDGYILFMGNVSFDVILQVVDEEGDIVFTTFVPAYTQTISLPADLEGDYELRLIQGYWYFYGWITL